MFALDSPHARVEITLYVTNGQTSTTAQFTSLICVTGTKYYSVYKLTP